MICYLYSPNIAGLGVAFSAAKLISVVADISYKMIFKLTNKSWLCGLVIRAICIVAAISALAIYIGLTSSKRLKEGYFTFGLVPMRVAQLVLLCLTVAGILLIPPWCQYPKEYFRTAYYNMGYGDDVESNYNNGMTGPGSNV